MTRVSCPWCHQTGTSGERCKKCLHFVGVSRLDCHCELCCAQKLAARLREEVDAADARLTALCGAAQDAADFVAEYRERVLKGRLAGDLLPNDYAVLKGLRDAIAGP